MTDRLAVFTDDRLGLHHQGPGHPECPARLGAIRHALRESAIAPRLDWRSAPPAPEAALLRCHSPAHVEKIKATEGRSGRLDPDTSYCPETYQAALHAAGCAVSAVESCLVGSSPSPAFCLVRPPGHHATRDEAMGFCYFNNAAIAARHAQSLGCPRVLVIDWDVHHGNGTQDIFYGDATVFYYSLHLYPHYPGTGSEGETGVGEGQGTTLNRPLPHGFPAGKMLELFERDLESIVRRFQPGFAIISCGFDAHRDDPLGGLDLVEDDFASLTGSVLRRMPPGRVVSLLEGGYNLDAIAASAVAHAGALLASRG